MKTSTIAGLVVVTGLAVGGAVMVSSRSGTGSAVAAAPGKLYPSLAGDSARIERVVVKRGAASVTLHQQGGAWVVDSKDGYPADMDKVRDAVRGMAGAEIVEPKTSKPELYAMLGVEDPASPGAASSLVTLEGPGGQVLASLIVGKQQFDEDPSGGMGKASTFVRRAGEAGSFLVKGEVRADADAMGWVSRSIADVGQDRVREVELVHGITNGVVPPERVRVSKARADEKEYVLEGRPEGRKLKDEFVLTRVAGVMSGLTMDDVAKAGAVELGGPQGVTAHVRCFDGLHVTARLVKKDGKVWADLHADFEPMVEPTPATAPTEPLKKEIDSLNAKWNGWVFQLPAWKGDLLMSKRDDLLGAPPATTQPSTSPATSPPVPDDPNGGTPLVAPPSAPRPLDPDKAPDQPPPRG